MTANVSIVTNTQAGALAVPLEAVQHDQAGRICEPGAGMASWSA